MDRTVYRYTLSQGVSFDDARATLDLALLGAISLHGEARVRLDGRHASDSDKRSVVIDAATPVGQSLNQLFVGYLRQEFGESAFRVERLAGAAPAESVPAAA